MAPFPGTLNLIFKKKIHQQVFIERFLVGPRALWISAPNPTVTWGAAHGSPGHFFGVCFLRLWPGAGQSPCVPRSHPVCAERVLTGKGPVQVHGGAAS